MSKDLLAKYYQKNKERIHKNSCESYQNLSKEEKDKKQEYSRERLRKWKKKLVEYRKNIMKCEKIKSLSRR